MTEPTRTRQLSGVNSLRAPEFLVDHPTLGITEMSCKVEMDGSLCHRLVNGLRSARYVTKDDQAALAALVITPANQISYELGRLGPDQQ